MEKRLLNLIEVSQYTGYKKSYIYKLIWEGKIPHSKPNGGRLFFDREKLDKWLLSNGTKSNVEKEIATASYISMHSK